MNSFDKIVLWATEQPRNALLQLLLQTRNVGNIPEYATKSALSSLLADAIMTKRTLIGSNGNLVQLITVEVHLDKSTMTQLSVQCMQ